MILYKKNTTVFYEDILGNGEIKGAPDIQLEYENHSADSKITISLFRYQNREHKNFFRQKFDYSAILDADGISYGSTFEEVITGIDNGIEVSATFGVPTNFTKQTSNSRTFDIQKGQLNNFRLRQAILNEHVESSRAIQSTVTSTNIVGQIFKASQDNINGLNLTLRSGDEIPFDDFESYADSAALQVEWISTDASYKAELEKVIVYEGNNSMECPSDAPEGTEWAKTFLTTDFTGYTGTFWMYNELPYNLTKMRVFIEDSIGNKSSASIVNQDALVWEFYEFPISTLTADGATAADVSDVIKIGFRLEDRTPNSSIYVDDMVSFEPPGSVDIELWDMGTSLPTSGVTSIDDGTQYTELGDKGLNGGTVFSSVRLNLTSGKRQYYIRQFSAGTALEIPGNTLLNANNYYALVLRYVDSDINVYGVNTTFATNYYQNGYAFTAPDNATAITQIGQYNDIQFSIFSTQDVYVNTLLRFYDAVPGGANSEFMNIEDKNMNITEIIFNDARAEQSNEIEFKDRSLFFEKGGKFEDNVNDDFTDSTTKMTLLIGYMYEPPIVNG